MMTFPSEFKQSLILFAAVSTLVVLYRKINLFEIFKSKTIKKNSDSIEEEQSIDDNLEFYEEQLLESAKMPSKVQQKFVKILTKQHLQNGATQDEISLFMKKFESDVSLKNGSIQQINELGTDTNDSSSGELTNGSNHVEVPDYVHINTPNDAYSLTNGDVCTKNVDISIKSHNSNSISNNLSPKSADKQKVLLTERTVESNNLNGEHNKENTSPSVLPEIPLSIEKKVFAENVCNDKTVEEFSESAENYHPNQENDVYVNCDPHSLNAMQGGSLVTKTSGKLAIQSSGVQVNESNLVHNFTRFQIDDKRTETYVPNFVQESKGVSFEFNEQLYYEFYLDQSLIGRLIGKGGSFISRVKHETKTYILIQEKHIVTKTKLCVIRGTEKGINDALQMIVNRFPVEQFPDFNLTLIDKYPYRPQFNPNSLLHFVMGMNNPVMVSCVVNPGHMFFQLVKCPIFQRFTDLNLDINSHYSTQSLSIGTPVEGMVCVVFIGTSWCRCVIVNIIDVDNCQIMLLDYGGYLVVSNSFLRQIHENHLNLKFQAVEGYLHNIKPANNATEWAIEAFQLVTSYLQISQSITVHIVNYNRDNTSLVNVYLQIDRKLYGFLNAMLVEHGYAEWINPPHLVFNSNAQSI